MVDVVLLSGWSQWSRRAGGTVAVYLCRCCMLDVIRHLCWGHVYMFVWCHTLVCCAFRYRVSPPVVSKCVRFTSGPLAAVLVLSTKRTQLTLGGCAFGSKLARTTPPATVLHQPGCQTAASSPWHHLATVQQPQFGACCCESPSRTTSTRQGCSKLTLGGAS